ncbi:MAG: hypothetical protein CFE21_11880 [Bacteroidetes bacterium B1(2017)]|nr:MAG: hypothetical protein CFE21_11880 [Bacteroidetes bacterium B1(2017)]
MKTLTIVSALLVFGLTSCKKDILEKATPTSNIVPVSNFKEIKASENFDWKTSKEINLKIFGFKTASPISRTLIVSSIDDKIVFYQGLQVMEQDGLIKLTIPSHIKDIKVTYGSIQKTLSVSQSELQFDYLTPIAE